MWSMDSYSRASTEALGFLLGGFAPPGAVLALHGELGAGKTLLTQGIARGMEIESPITSPTFTIVNQYIEGRGILNHLDVYRINDEADLEELGLWEYFTEDALCVVEWPEVLGELLPEDAVHIYLTKRFSVDGEEWRHIEIKLVPSDEKNRFWLTEAMSKYSCVTN